MRGRGTGELPTSRWAASSPSLRDLPRGHQRRHVAGGAPGDEAAARGVWPAEHPGDPGECLVLGENRSCAGLPEPAENVRGAGDEVEGDRGAGGGGRDVGEVHRVVLRAGGRLEHPVEDPECSLSADAGRGDRASGIRRQLGCRPRRRHRIGVPHDPLCRPVEGELHDVGLVAPHGVDGAEEVRFVHALTFSPGGAQCNSCGMV